MTMVWYALKKAVNGLWKLPGTALSYIRNLQQYPFDQGCI